MRDTLKIESEGIKIQIPQLFDQDPREFQTPQKSGNKAKFDNSKSDGKNNDLAEYYCSECGGLLLEYTGELTCSQCGLISGQVYGLPHTLTGRNHLNYKDYFWGEPLQSANRMFYYQEAKTPKLRSTFFRMAKLNRLRDDQDLRVGSAFICLQKLEIQFHFPSLWIYNAIHLTKKVLQSQPKQEDIHFIAVCALFITARQHNNAITSVTILKASGVHATLNRMHKVLAQYAPIWGHLKHWAPTGLLKENLQKIAVAFLPALNNPKDIQKAYEECKDLFLRTSRLRGSTNSIIATIIYLHWQKYYLTQKQVAEVCGTNDTTIRGIKRQIQSRLIFRGAGMSETSRV